MGPCHFLPEHLFCLSHHKTRWTMSVDNVGLKIGFLGDLELHDHSNIFFLGVNRSGLKTNSIANQRLYRTLGRVEQPITTFTGPWDEFMIHGVNNPFRFIQIE